MKWLVVLSVLLTSCIFSKTKKNSVPPTDKRSDGSFNILNGDKENFRVGSIPRIEGDGRIGSGAIVQWPRCVLTAAHVVDNVTAGYTIRFKDQSLMDKEQSVVKIVKIPDWSLPSRDLAILWVANSLSAGADDKKIELKDYAPLIYAQNKIQSLPAEILITSNPNPYLDVEITGHGDTGNGVDYTHGNAKLVALTERNNGADYQVFKGSEFQIQCKGDSGSPVLYGDTIHAVTSIVGDRYSTVPPNDCNSVQMTFNTATYIHKKWINDTILRTCGKFMNVTPPMGGKVIGTITHPNHETSVYEPNALELNKKIKCISGGEDLDFDCKEILHHPNDTLEMTASCPDNYPVFKKWNGWDGRLCNCIGQGQTCKLTFSQMGKYGVGESADEEYCYPVCE